jgi:multiple sugar transport system substrate-binding protein
VLILAAGLADIANAEAVCSHDLRVLAQPRDGLTLLEKYKDEFKGLSGASFNIDYLNENDRRAKSRADASTVGKYNVYYVDEANVALFAKSNWVAPLLDYYPKDYDFADFDPGQQKVATFEDKVYFAPLTGGWRSARLPQGSAREGGRQGAHHSGRDDGRCAEAA